MSEHSTPPSPGRRPRVTRDLIFWLVGLGLMIYHGFGLGRLFGMDSEPVLWAFIGGMVISGVPGAIQAFLFITGRSAPPAPLPSPDPSSSPEPSSPSSGA